MTNVVSPIGHILVHQDLQNAKTQNAAPCFNYYPLDANNDPLSPLSPTDLYNHLVKRLEDAADVSPTEKKKLLQIADYVKNKVPPNPSE